MVKFNLNLVAGRSHLGQVLVAGATAPESLPPGRSWTRAGFASRATRTRDTFSRSAVVSWGRLSIMVKLSLVAGRCGSTDRSWTPPFRPRFHTFFGARYSAALLLPGPQRSPAFVLLRLRAAAHLCRSGSSSLRA